MVVNRSGRGDKDMQTVMFRYGTVPAGETFKMSCLQTRFAELKEQNCLRPW